MMADAFEAIASHLRGKFGLPPDWHAWKLEAVGEGSPEDVVVLVTGAVCPHRVTRGPRKGEVAFRRHEGRPTTYPITLRAYRDLLGVSP
jgi:hypothetical protein